jgi:hypothetical protein
MTDKCSSYQKFVEKHGHEYFRQKQGKARASSGERRFGINGLSIPENTVKIIKDPDSDGGFGRGAMIGNFAEGLALGSFTENTVVEYKGQQFQIVGKVKQRLVRVD